VGYSFDVLKYEKGYSGQVNGAAVVAQQEEHGYQRQEDTTQGQQIGTVTKDGFCGGNEFVSGSIFGFLHRVKGSIK
jgi:hypothetical protein